MDTRPMKARLSAFAYRVSMVLARTLFFAVARWEVVGRERVPASGPVILVANHTHFVDPPLVAASAPRRVHPMAKREIFETPLIGWVFWVLGAFPVRRFSGDLGALRAAQSYLRHGEVVLMFPEGTRSRGRGLQPALPGAAMVALLSRAPVVPVGVTGTNLRLPLDLLRRPRLRVEFGEPFDFSEQRADAHAAERATDLMMRCIAALLPETDRGVYGAETAGTIVVRREPREQREAAGEA